MLGLGAAARGPAAGGCRPAAAAGGCRPASAGVTRATTSAQKVEEEEEEFLLNCGIQGKYSRRTLVVYNVYQLS